MEIGGCDLNDTPSAIRYIYILGATPKRSGSWIYMSSAAAISTNHYASRSGSWIYMSSAAAISTNH